MIVALARRHVGPPAAGMEAVRHDDAPGRAQHRHAADGERIGVMERQRVEQPLAALFQHHQAACFPIPACGVEEIAVAEDAPLGPPGRARGVEQGRLVVDAGRAAGARVDAGCRQPGLEGRRHPQSARRPSVRRTAASTSASRSGTETTRTCLRMIEEIDRLVPPVSRVDQARCRSPEALSAHQCRWKSGLFSSSSATRWPRPYPASR